MVILPYDCIETGPGASSPEPRRMPWANLVLAALFCTVFLMALFGVLSPEWSVSSVFVPLGWMAHLNTYHLTANILLLVAFGNFANRRMGTWPYVTFAVTSGIGGALTHAFLSSEPVVGASAIVFAALGYTLAVAPRMPVHCTYWFVVKWGTRALPVFVVGGIILLGQVLVVLLGADTRISYPAHAFGLCWGLLVGTVARMRHRNQDRRTEA